MSATVFLSTALALMGPPGTSKGPTPTFAVVPHCVTSIIREAQVPAREAGELRELKAELLGKKVNAKDQLAQIDDEVSQNKRELADFEHQAAEAQAETETRILAAVAGYDVAVAELAQSEHANKKNPGTVSATQIRKEKLAVEHARLQIDLAKHEKLVAGFTSKGKESLIRAADIDITRRHIIAPIDGVVVQLLKHQGEWVNPGDPILRIVYLETLRVEGFMKASDLAPVDIADRPVVIEIKLPGGRVEKFSGDKVTNVRFVPLVEASGEYRVWADVTNREVKPGHWILLPGMSAEMTIELAPPPAAASPAKPKPVK